MSTTAWKSPATAASSARSSSIVAWTNPTNAVAYDQSYALAALVSNGYTDWLRLTNYGFADADIPVGATILGIEAQVSRKSVATANDIKDSSVYLRKASGQVGSDGATATAWPTTEGDEIHGGAANLWGTTWSDSDFKSSSFGIDMSAQRYGGVVAYAEVDVIQIRVTYSTAIVQTYTSAIKMTPALGVVVTQAFASAVKLASSLASAFGYGYTLTSSIVMSSSLARSVAVIFSSTTKMTASLGRSIATTFSSAVKLTPSLVRAVRVIFTSAVRLTAFQSGGAIVNKVFSSTMRLTACLTRWRLLNAIRNLGKARCAPPSVREQPRIDDGLSG